MSIKQRVSYILKEMNQLPRKVTVPVTAGTLLVVLYALTFFIEKPVQFSYAGETCIRQVSLFPDLSKAADETGYRIQAKDVFRIGNVAVFSPKTCFTATTAPQPGVTKITVAPFGSLFARKTFALRVSDPPIARVGDLSKPIPTGKPLTVSLDTPDVIYDYNLRVGDKSTDCESKTRSLQCSLDTLALEQGKDYRIKLARSYKNKPVDTLVDKTITTLSATNIIKAGIVQDQTIYERPTTFEFEFDKNVTDATVELVKLDGEKRIPVEQTVQSAANKATIALTKELDRNAKYEVEVTKLSAEDGSILAQPYKASFTVSGGPKLTGANVRATGAGLTQTVVLTFDQPLSDTQDISKFASVKGVAGTITKKANQVLVSYTGAPKCVDFTISFAKGLESKYQIPQADVQNFSSRTVCHTVQTIGYSKAGRPIQAYFFGNGTQSVLFTGAFHGNERNSKVIMDNWISELEAKAKEIPPARQVVVVPVVNPDGIAAGKRNNANNVDLNRNFITSNWQKDITSPTKQPIPNGGGASPMSEPETQAIAGLTSRLRPRVTLSYHSVAGYAIGNEAGDSAALAATYSRLSGYRNMTGNGGAFDYSTTGTYEDWIAQKLGLPSLIIELASSTNAEFTRNRSALWAMIRS